MLVTQPSLYWHDYETFGIDPRRDRPAQFAGVRTDLDFNIIEAPLVVYCKPPADYLPHPEACLLTGISPQVAESKGLIEADFCRLIHAELSRPDTCGLGYNSIRFDDEFTRNCLYRNFYDPYAREWQNGNSRWDVIDLVRAAKALRPDGIVWPTDMEGRPSFKLEDLTKANGIAHEEAHDALSDVFATIALGKLIKAVQPKLYQFLWQHRVKTEAFKLLQFGSFKPVVHISGRYPSFNDCLAVVLPICKHPINANGMVVYDLSVDPEPLITLSSEEIHKRVFTATKELPDDAARIPLKTVHTNKCPVLAPISVLGTKDQERLKIDLATCYDNIGKIKASSKLADKINEVFSSIRSDDVVQEIDPDLEIYSGGFFSEQDRQKMIKVRGLRPQELASFSPNFNDSRLVEMLFRYRARNYPEFLSSEENSKWKTFCANRLKGLQAGGGITLDEYLLFLSNLPAEDLPEKNLITELQDYALEKARSVGLAAT